MGKILSRSLASKDDPMFSEPWNVQPLGYRKSTSGSPASSGEETPKGSRPLSESQRQAYEMQAYVIARQEYVDPLVLKGKLLLAQHGGVDPRALYEKLKVGRPKEWSPLPEY